MNDDLISRSALRKNVNSFFDSHYKGLVSSDLIKYAEAVDELIDNAPTVDTTFREVVAYECGQKSVEERPKGKWEVDELRNTVCSICGGIRRDSRDDHVSYCNKCGARME